MSDRTPNNPIPETITTSKGTYEWQHQFDYAKNGILHYYREDENGEVMSSVKHSNGEYHAYDLGAEELIEFLQAYIKGREA